ncbi:MAG: DUF1587 domain-containing protein, partial [Roseimicrobium sp.]
MTSLFKGSLTVLVGLSAVLASATASSPQGPAQYQQRVLPLLQEFCYDCHGDGISKGNFSLDSESSLPALLKDFRLWDNVREHVDTHVMPPEGKPQPTLEQRAAIVRWIEDEVFWVDPSRPGPGHVTLRRLNRAEYNNTVRDVFKIESRPADSFPPDDAGYGYDNIGDVLSLSPLLMEKYLKAARRVAEEAVWVRPEGMRLLREKDADEFQDVTETSDKMEGGIRSISQNGDIAAKFDFPAVGVWRAALSVSATQAGPENARCAVLLDGNEVRQFEVTANLSGSEHTKWQTFRFDIPVKGSHRVSVRFLNDFYDEQAPDANRRDRNLYVQSLRFEGPIKFRSLPQSKLLDVLSEGKNLTPRSLVLRGGDFDAGPTGVDIANEGAVFFSNGYATRNVEIAEAGTYKLHFKLGADQAGPEKPRLRIRMGDHVLVEAQEISAKTVVEPQRLTLSAALTKGTHELRVEFLNDFNGDGGKDRNAYLAEVTIEAPGAGTLALDREVLRRWLKTIATRAYRRPPEPDDLQRLDALA